MTHSTKQKEPEGLEKPHVVVKLDGKQKAEKLRAETQTNVKGNRANKALKPLRSQEPSETLLEQAPAQQRDLEEEWETKNLHSSSTRKWLVLGLAAVAVAVVSAVLWAAVGMSGSPSKVLPEASARLSDASVRQQIISREDTIRAYLAAETVEEKARYVRHPERVKPLMEAYYAKHPLEPSQLEKVVSEKVQTLGNQLTKRPFWVTTVNTAGGEVRGLLIETDVESRSLIDWETGVTYQPNDWDAFYTNKPTEPQRFRVYLEPIEHEAFYGYEFSDYKKYRCFRVSIKGSDKMLWAYTEIGSEADIRALTPFAGGGTTVRYGMRLPVVVELRYPEQSMTEYCVHLDRFIQATWVYVETPEAN